MTPPSPNGFSNVLFAKIPKPKNALSDILLLIIALSFTNYSSPFALILDPGPRMYCVLIYISREKVFETFKVPKLSNLTNIFQQINFTDILFALKDINTGIPPLVLRVGVSLKSHGVAVRLHGKACEIKIWYFDIPGRGCGGSCQWKRSCQLL
jgi:hypothetical protein